MTDIPKTRWARTVDGACIAYQDFGEGPSTLVFVHGWASHLEVVWELPQFARYLRRLAKSLRVLHFDKRGVGMSDRLSGAPDLDVQMDDIRAVMDAAGVERAALYGWGWISPALAAFFAATHPERTEALLLDGPCTTRRTRTTRGASRGGWRSWVGTFCPTWGTDKNTRSSRASSPAATARRTVLVRDPTFLRWLAKWCATRPRRTASNGFARMWRDTDIRPVLPTIRVPTAVLKTRSGDPGGAAASASTSRDAHPRRVARIELDRGPTAHPDRDRNGTPTRRGFIASVEDEEAALDRILATVLFTDIVGSTDKACEVGDARWKELLERHDAVVRAHLARYRGDEVKTDRRRLPRDLRRAGASGEVRPGASATR